MLGNVPAYLSTLGCIVNLAGNHGLEEEGDIPDQEKQSLLDIYHATKGHQWNIKTNWLTEEHISKWYKVGNIDIEVAIKTLKVVLEIDRMCV